MKGTKDFILAIENIKIDILKTSDDLYGYELSDIKKHGLEQKIKASAQQGYTGHLIGVLSVKDEYTRRRLDNEKTLELLREVLGPGFRVRHKIYRSRNILTGDTYISDKKIYISWE